MLRYRVYYKGREHIASAVSSPSLEIIEITVQVGCWGGYFRLLLLFCRIIIIWQTTMSKVKNSIHVIKQHLPYTVSLRLGVGFDRLYTYTICIRVGYALFVFYDTGYDWKCQRIFYKKGTAARTVKSWFTGRCRHRLLQNVTQIVVICRV